MAWRPCCHLALTAALLGVGMACGGSGNSPIPGGDSAGSASAGSPPTLTAVSPSSGPSQGGTLVTLTGANFHPDAAVRFGMANVAPDSITSTEIQVRTPPHDPGTFAVWVFNPGGSEQAAALFHAFTFEPPAGQALLFTDVTRQAGLDFLHRQGVDQMMGIGAAVADFDGDGWPDLYIPNQVGANAFYLNRQDGTFRESAAAAGVALEGSLDNGACTADYDNDGDPDLYVTADGPNHLFRNNGDATFSDVTAAAGVGDSLRGMSCAWGDYDGDSWLDLYVTNYGDESADPPAPDSDILYHNRGDGTFADVTAALPFAAHANMGFAVSWVDFDADGDLDLYIVNDFGAIVEPNILVRNDGPAADGPWLFTDVSEPSGADLQQFGMGLAVGDYDRDGWLDFYTTDIGSNDLLRNEGDATFALATDAAGVSRSAVPGTNANNVGWGAFFFDFDNDGDEDLYAVAGSLREHAGDLAEDIQPNIFFRNDGDATFTDISSGSGTNDPGRGRGGVYLDFDRDADLDLLVLNFHQAPLLLRNDQNTGNAWLSVRLIGSDSNRDAIGARLSVTVGDLTLVREIRSGSSHCSSLPRTAYFGLGEAETIDALEVRWPSGTVQTFFQVPARQHLTLQEP